VARLYRGVLDGTLAPAEAEVELRGLTEDVPWQNGFLHGREGMAWTERRLVTA